MAGSVIPLDCNGISKEGFRELADIGMTDVWAHGFPQWSALEPEEDVFQWDMLDEYIANAQHAGIRLVIRLNGIPRWINPAWLPSCGRDDCTGRHFMISPWSKPGAALLKDRIARLYERYRGANVTINPPQPYAEYWLMHGLYCPQPCRRDNLWCYDKEALADYQVFLESHGRPPQLPARSPIPSSQEEAANVADTLTWHWQSLRTFWQDLYFYCSALGQKELWAALVPRVRFLQITSDVGIFRMEEWVNELCLMLKQQQTDLNMIFFSVFTSGPIDFFFYVYVTRRYGWKVWVGAEGPNNILYNTPRAIELGFSGVVVAAPTGQTWFNYGPIDKEEAMENVRLAAKQWKEAE